MKAWDFRRTREASHAAEADHRRSLLRLSSYRARSDSLASRQMFSVPRSHFLDRTTVLPGNRFEPLRANSKDHSMVDDDIGGKPNQADSAA
ncbi:hypothetical protein [Bradyrhizobium sp. F1.4.3]|uniref:hypothetical protein n=1 Tax=Bradyrhizobium sp. F1.4.3 TaxID=3156356 RepID=UPI003390F4DB